MNRGGARQTHAGSAISSALRESLTAFTRGLAHHAIRQRPFPRLLRSRAVTALGHRVSASALINAHVTLAGSSQLVLGPRSFVNEGTYFDLTGAITIGSNCSIGHQGLFLTASHTIAGNERRAGDFSIAPITVGDGTWIGARVTVLPGVRIGSGCVIAAGSIVTKDLPDNGIYAGVPARLKRSLTTSANSKGAEAV